MLLTSCREKMDAADDPCNTSPLSSPVGQAHLMYPNRFAFTAINDGNDVLIKLIACTIHVYPQYHYLGISNSQHHLQTV